MPKATIIQADRSYTFADYFKLNFAPQDILAYFQVSLQRRSLKLPRSSTSLLQSQQTFLAIEAKNEDLERGFLQLAIELIALDRWIDSEQPILPGAISTGNIWQFARFDRQTRQVTQDLDLYRVPADLEALLPILVKILET